MRVLVVGAGVLGLTSATVLAEAGHRADVLARDLPLETTSAVAAAFWYPYLAQPFDRVLAWSKASLETFGRLAGSDAGSGVVMREGTELLREQTADPWWASAVPVLRREPDLPEPYLDGWSFSAPVIEMPQYLTWLTARLEGAGGTVTRMTLAALPEHADVVVNCTGLGARALARDDSVTPVRGQVVRLSQVGLDRWWLDGEGLTYVVPRSRDIIVGGTDSVGDWGQRPDPATAEALLARARRLVPELAGASILGHRVGLRPARPTVRLEQDESVTERRLVHCYGHGGAGVTVSWGCAQEVLDLVENAAPSIP